eukprot:5108421-Amphidinium_carterae.1
MILCGWQQSLVKVCKSLVTVREPRPKNPLESLPPRGEKLTLLIMALGRKSNLPVAWGCCVAGCDDSDFHTRTGEATEYPYSEEFVGGGAGLKCTFSVKYHKEICVRTLFKAFRSLTHNTTGTETLTFTYYSLPKVTDPNEY